MTKERFHEQEEQKETAKNQNRKKNFPWALTIVGGILLTVMIFQLVGASGASDSDNSGTPKIAVEESNIDLGYIKLGEYRSLKIKVTNTGDGTYVVRSNPTLKYWKGAVILS